ncbi:tyrosine-type recombinase/integrase [Spongiimicrobium sp. 3-5]|uniref:tyrosine-type recombinase/integrase n=1 Tax=Spongiimicrobium sp. 3-5 TaxID=3332596 RepID=UPI00397FEBCF
MNFTEYLLKNRYSKSTIRVHLLRIRRLQSWLKNQGIEESGMTYPQMLQYTKYLQTEKGYERQSINNELRAIKLYHDYLIEENIAMENPATDMTIRGTRTKAIGELLDSEELEDLYYSYQTQHHDTFFRASKLRDKVVIGLMVFQGVTVMELHHMQEEHLQLKKGKVDVPSTRRGNARTLKLQPCQMMELLQYVEEARPYLSEKDRGNNPEKLFFGSIDQMHSITSRILKYMKENNQKVRGCSSLRTSIIINWLKIHSLRKVQIMAGHRYISSTEKYLQNDIENLHDIVENFHPIN